MIRYVAEEGEGPNEPLSPQLDLPNQIKSWFSTAISFFPTAEKEAGRGKSCANIYNRGHPALSLADD